MVSGDGECILFESSRGERPNDELELSLTWTLTLTQATIQETSGDSPREGVSTSARARFIARSKAARAPDLEEVSSFTFNSNPEHHRVI